MAESFQNINLREKCSSESFEISDLCVLEWTEIWVRIENAEVSDLYFGRERAQKHQNEWRYTFRNYLGKSQIRLQLKDGREITLDGIEVISPKTLDEKRPIFYPKLLKTLFEELCWYAQSMPFDWSAPTEFPTEEKDQPPSLIFVLHTLSEKADEIRYALQNILCNPYWKLFTENRWGRLGEPRNLDADTVLMIPKHPEYLRPYYGGELSKLADLLRSPAGKRFIPERVFEGRVDETLDTPENRFIKHFVNSLLFLRDELEQKGYLRRENIMNRD